MRYVILFLIVTGLLVFAGIKIEDVGSVALTLDSGTYRMKFGVFLMLLVVLVLLLMLGFWLIWKFIKLPKNIKGFFSNRQARKANDLLQIGLLELGQGRWKQAENHLAKGARIAGNEDADTSLYLSGAAMAAQRLGADGRRDHYLLQAKKQQMIGVDTFSTDLTEASLLLEQGDAQKALNILAQHQGNAGLSPELLRLEYRAQQKLGQFEAAWDMLPRMKKRVFDAVELAEQRHKIAKIIFSDQSSRVELMDKTWKALGKNEKQDDDLILGYVSGLLTHEKFDEAELVLAKAIKQSYSEPLIHAYSQLEKGSTSTMLNHISSWLRYQPDNAFLHFAAAKNYFKKNEFEKAKEHAEKSLKLDNISEVYALLGRIYEASDEPALAMSAYKNSVNLVYRQDEVKQGELLELVNDNVEKLENQSS